MCCSSAWQEFIAKCFNTEVSKCHKSLKQFRGNKKEQKLAHVSGLKVKACCGGENRRWTLQENKAEKDSLQQLGNVPPQGVDFCAEGTAQRWNPSLGTLKSSTGCTRFGICTRTQGRAALSVPCQQGSDSNTVLCDCHQALGSGGKQGGKLVAGIWTWLCKPTV